MVVGLAVAAIVLGYLGFERQPAEPAETGSRLDHLYHSLQLFAFEYSSSFQPRSWELDVARLLAPAVTFYAAARALASIFRERVQLLRMRFTPKQRVVICGLGRKGLLFARSFLADGCRVAVIERHDGNDLIRGCREAGVPVVIGDATDPAVLRRAQVHRADYLVAVCGRDGTNADVAARARDLSTRGRHRKGALTAFVHLVDLELCDLLRGTEAAAREDEASRLEFFNVFEIGARGWLIEYPPFARAGAIDGRPHLLILGAGEMGRALVAGAARSWITQDASNGERPRVTIVDLEAGRRRDALRIRYPHLERICELVPVTADITGPELENGRLLAETERGCPVTTVYICLDDDVRGVTAALALLPQLRGRPVTLVVRTVEDAGLAAVLRQDGAGRTEERLRAFPVLDRTCTRKLLLGETPNELLARAIHEGYVSDQTQAGETVETNPSLVPWHALPEGLKESNRRQADHVALKLEAVDLGTLRRPRAEVELIELSSEEVELLAELEHERWLGERLFDGWTYAPGPKDLARKTSPDLVPWAELSEDEKEKDRNTARRLPALLADADLQLYRLAS